MLHKIGSIALLFLALTACTEAPAPAPTPPAPTKDPATYRADCAALVDAYAIWQAGCLGAELPASRVDDLVAHCSARAALPGVTVQKGAFQNCAVAISVASCAGLPLECLSPIGYDDNSALGSYVWTGSGFGDLYYDLFPRAPGALAAGAACSIGGQCQSGTCTSHDSCGICVDLRATGETCGETALCYRDQCVDGVCVEIGLGAGSSCQDTKGSSDCLSSLYCNNGTCVPRAKLGDACPEYPFVCPVGSRCSDSVCQPIVDVHEGEACDFSTAQCTGEGLFCIDGLCRKPVDHAGLGADCSYDFCAPGLKCASFTCVVPGNAGAPCGAYDSCAAGLACLHGEGSGSGGSCGIPLSEGATCYELKECGDGAYCDFSAGGGGVCVSEGSGGPACGDRRPCHGALICREGVCGALDVCRR